MDFEEKGGITFRPRELRALAAFISGFLVPIIVILIKMSNWGLAVIVLILSVLLFYYAWRR